MNINKKITDESDFNVQYAAIYREFTKISSNILCNAIVAYNSIFTIAISQNGFEEKLYWYIGDFMYVCAKERRSRIFSAPDWFEAYCIEFDKYAIVVESINAICTFLNDVLVKNNKGRKMCDFGYLLWDRCVLHHVEPNKHISLCDELLKRIERPSLSYKKALQSLKKIIPDTDSPLYFYEQYYEEKALAYIKDVYSCQLSFSSFLDYAAQVEEVFVFESQRMNLIFLEESHSKVIKILENVCIVYHESYIYNSVYDLLISDQTLLQRIFRKLYLHSNQFCTTVRKALRSYIQNVVLKDVNEIHLLNKDDSIFFSKLNSIYLESEKLILLYFDDKGLADDLFNSKFNELTNKSYNERLISFYNKAMISDKYTEIICIFKTHLRFVNDFGALGTLYHETLKKRLLSYRYIFIREKENLECLRSYLDVVTYKKCVKMIKDVNWSIVFNKLLIPFLESNNEFTERNHLKYFTSILNLCAWPLDSDYDKPLKLGKLQQAYVNALESYFSSRYSDRRLIWLWEDSIVYLELLTDKTYTLKMDILHSTVLLCFSEYDKLSASDLSELTNLRETDINRILSKFLTYRLIVEKDTVYTLNANFYNVKGKIHITQSETQAQLEQFDFNSYYQDLIIKKMIKYKTIERRKLEGSVMFEHCLNTPFNKDAFDKCISELINKGKITILGEFYELVK